MFLKTPKSMLHLLKLLLLLSSFCIYNAHAGSPGPYRIVFLDISKPPYQDGQDLMKQLRKQTPQDLAEEFSKYSVSVDNYYRDGRCFVCRSSNMADNGLGHIYLHSIPVGLCAEDARKAVAGDVQARNKMQKILQDFRNPEEDYVDGIILYEHQAGKVTLYAIEAKPGTRITSVSKEVKSRLRLTSLDALMYEAAKKIERKI